MRFGNNIPGIVYRSCNRYEVSSPPATLMHVVVVDTKLISIIDIDPIQKSAHPTRREHVDGYAR